MKKNKASLLSMICNTRWPLGCLVFFIAACTNNAQIKPMILTATDSLREKQRVENAFHHIDSLIPFIKSGDVITRTGNDFTSESLRSLNRRDKTYSHCGIAMIENDSVFIYHALGGEFNPDQKLLREPVRMFAEPFSNKGIGIFRFSLSETSFSNLSGFVHDVYKRGVRFDMDFDLATDDRMYCAEFVTKSFIHAYDPQITFAASNIGSFSFYGVDDIFLSKGCDKIASVVYK